MKNIYFAVSAVVFILIFSFSSCAKRGMITGGVKDTLAPIIVNASPENFSTNFSGNTIKIVFNEFIKVKDINKQLIISPPFKKQPVIMPQGSASKFISVRILDTLQPNTTYSLNFGQSITDHNEGNPYSQFKYVFSTGSHIDSLSLLGTIKDAFEQKPDNFISVQLYDAETFTDSTVYKEAPLYVTNTLDSARTFSLENLKAGSYYLIALKDKNSNYKFDPKQDKIAFLKDKITLPNDTLYQLELFKEQPVFKAEKPIQQSNNKFYMGFSGNVKKAKITAQNGSEKIPVAVTAFPQAGKDSVQLFIPTLKIDSLTINVEYENYAKSFTTKIKTLKETDSLKIAPLQQGTLHFRDTLKIKTSTPVKNIDTKRITILNKDSVTIPFTHRYDDFKQELSVDFAREENQKYQIELLPDAIEDLYNTKNDTLSFVFSTKSYTDYGNLAINLKKVKRFPILLQVLTPKGDITASAVSKGERTLRFDFLEPNIYRLRIIYDDNGNGIWDTGNYLEKRQAEEIEYYQKEIDVRANWDIIEEF